MNIFISEYFFDFRHAQVDEIHVLTYICLEIISIHVCIHLLISQAGDITHINLGRGALYVRHVHGQAFQRAHKIFHLFYYVSPRSIVKYRINY